MKSCFLSALFIALGLQSQAPAAIVVVDSFDQGGFSLALFPAFEYAYENVNLPLADSRNSTIPGRLAAPGSVMTSTLNPVTGQLSFLATGSSNSANAPLGLCVIYSKDGPYNLLGYTGFVFDFSVMSGAGTLLVELGSGSAIYGPSARRITLNGPGEVFYSFADLNFGSGDSVDFFFAMHFAFEARSPEFSFTLDEIRLVPEPSGALLTLAAGAGLLARRRRGPGGKK